MHQQKDSPQRGRLRPKSASIRKHASSMREIHHQDGQNNKFNYENKDDIENWQNETGGKDNAVMASNSPSKRLQTKSRPPRPQSAPHVRNKAKSDEFTDDDDEPDVSQVILNIYSKIYMLLILVFGASLNFSFLNLFIIYGIII